MALKVRWTKRALINLTNTASFIESEWGTKVANQFLLRIFNLVNTLTVFPSIGSVEIEEKLIRGILITKHNQLYYRVNKIKNELIVLNIFDNRRKKKRI